MNNIYKNFTVVFTIMLVLVFTSCDDDTGQDPVVKEATPELKLSEKSLNVEIGKTIDFNISEGGGDYSVFSSNEDIIKAELSGNTIMVSGVGLGQASVIVSDGNNKYNEVSIFSYYTDILLETFETNLRYGHTERTMSISIAQGNGGYKVESSNEELATAEISDDDSSIILKLKGQCNATLTLSDAFAVKTIPISIGTTNEPYTASELEKIMANDIKRVVHLEEDASTEWWFKYTRFIGTMENDKNLYGLEYYRANFRKAINMWIRFEGDTSVGEKTGGSFTRTVPNYRIEHDDQPADVEIIKNDGSKIWAIWSFTQDDKLFYGHFCLDI